LKDGYVSGKSSDGPDGWPGQWAVFAGMKRGEREVNAGEAKRLSAEKARLQQQRQRLEDYQRGGAEKMVHAISW